MSKTLVVKDPRRGATRSLSIIAAGVVAVGGFLWLTDSREHEAIPMAQPAALALSADSSTADAAVDLMSDCGSRVDEFEPGQGDLSRVPSDAMGQGGADYAIVSVTTSENGPLGVDYERLDMQGVDRTPVDVAPASLIR